MRQHLTTLLMGCAAVLAASTAGAQWRNEPHPSRGACFYEHPGYEGRYFCVAAGRQAEMVPLSANDQISAVKIYGGVNVTVYKDRDFRGSSRRFTSSIRDLAWVGWSNRISSYRVDDRYDNYNGSWGGAYGGGSWSGGGSHSTGWGGAYGGGSHSSWGKHEGGRWTYQEAQQIVQRAYRSTLGREPDAAAQAWVNDVMRNNLSQSDLERKLRQSAEYKQKFNKR